MKGISTLYPVIISLILSQTSFLNILCTSTTGDMLQFKIEIECFHVLSHYVSHTFTGPSSMQECAFNSVVTQCRVCL